jgi:hypothetical protein
MYDGVGRRIEARLVSCLFGKELADLLSRLWVVLAKHLPLARRQYANGFYLQGALTPKRTIARG